MALSIWSAIVAILLAIAYRSLVLGAIIFLCSFAVIFLCTYIVLGTNYVYGGLDDKDVRDVSLID